MKLKIFKKKIETVLFKRLCEEKKYIIFDQLNSLYAKYYSKLEATTLLNRSGFIDVELFHRHGYSCTALAKNSKFYFSIGTLVGNGIKRIFT